MAHSNALRAFAPFASPSFESGSAASEPAAGILKETEARILSLCGPSIEKITVGRAVLGLFFSGVELSTGHGGLCFTPLKEIPEAVCCPSSARAMPYSGKLNRRPVLEYLKHLDSPGILNRTLAIAALNALSSFCFSSQADSRAARVTQDGVSYEILKSRDAFDELPLFPGEKTVVVGALAPILKKLLKGGHSFVVLEQDPRTLKDRELPYFAPAGEFRRHIPDADLLVITGTSVINGTLEALLDCAKPSARILVTGPTASMLPDAFFRRGVTMLGGIIVTEPAGLLDIIGQGGSGYHFFGKYAERVIIRKARPALSI